MMVTKKVRSIMMVVSCRFPEKREVLGWLADEVGASLLLMCVPAAVCWFLVWTGAMGWWFLSLIALIIGVLGTDKILSRDEPDMGRVLLFFALGMAIGACLGQFPSDLIVPVAKVVTRALGITVLAGLAGLVLALVFNKPARISIRAWAVGIGLASFLLIVAYHLLPQVLLFRWLALAGVSLMSVGETFHAVNLRTFKEEEYLGFPLALLLNAFMLTGALVQPPTF